MSDEVYYDEDWNVIPMPLEQWKLHLAEQAEQGPRKIVDAYGTELQSGDSILSIKPLPVKNGININKGEKFTKIRLTDDPELVLAKHPKNGEMYLRTEFFQKIV